MNKLQKFFAVVFLLITLGLLFKIFIEYRGRDFPLENQLSYTVGTLDMLPAKQSRVFTILHSSQPPYQDITFSCAYSAHATIENTECLNYTHIRPLVGKQAKIGWYSQPTYLGFNNSYPQLVTLEIENKPYRTYEDTVNTIDSINGGLIYFIPFILILYFGIFFIYNKLLA